MIYHCSFTQGAEMVEPCEEKSKYMPIGHEKVQIKMFENQVLKLKTNCMLCECVLFMTFVHRFHFVILNIH